MRLSTIWTLHSMPMRERFSQTREWGNLAMARKLPAKLRYWVTVSELAKATIDSPNVPATPLEEILKNLEGGPK